MRPCLNSVVIAPGTPPARVIRAAIHAGFPAVEISSAKLRLAVATDPDLVPFLRAHEAVPAHGGWNIRLHWPRQDFDAALAHLDEAMEFAASLGSRGGTLVLPHASPDGPPIPTTEDVIDRIGIVADHAQRAGLILAVEFMGTHPNAPASQGIRTLADTLTVLAAVGRRPNAGILLDAFHWHTSGGTVQDIAQIPPGMPVHVHLSDAPDLPREALRDADRLLPGDGVIDLTGFLGALRARGYDGLVSVELKHRELHRLAPQRAAEHAFAALTRVLGPTFGAQR